jgi:23S rRNA (cytosine1962-C5)-methyltransferase
MLSKDAYQLLDFGSGRKLERFGPYTLDRPSPAAEDATLRDPARWLQADTRYDRDAPGGKWTCARAVDEAWPLGCGSFTLELKRTQAGHLGVFPEQAANWDWIAERVSAAGRSINVLNLFAYTGASTLAAAAAGAAVTHVDAAAGVVAWARRNAELSGLAEAPIRWIVDDVRKFAARELRRGKRYDAVILDPPSYGHGPRGEVWKLEDRLGELVELCWALTEGQREFMLLSCHSGPWAFATPLLKQLVSEHPQLRSSGQLAGENIHLASAAGGQLHAGATVRWTRTPAATRPATLGRTNGTGDRR